MVAPSAAGKADCVSSKRPVVFACAGCSFSAHLAWQLAKELESRGHAEMSCLAGVAAQRPAFRRLPDTRECWVIDGCPIDCGHGVFEQLGRVPDRHIRLYEAGISKHEAPYGGVNWTKLVDHALRVPEEEAAK